MSSQLIKAGEIREKYNLPKSGLLDIICTLADKLEQRDKALAFYANESNYDMDYDPSEGHSSEILMDSGEKAREALA